MQKDYSNTTILGHTYPVIGLSPMDGITDYPFRKIVKKYGNPDLIFTEFTNVMGLSYSADKLLPHFYYDESERTVIAQIYGAEPDYFYHAAKIVCALGFDGVDINMGCPATSVATRGAGAGLIKTPDLAREIVFQVKKGVEDWVNDGKITGLKEHSTKAVEGMRLHFQVRLQNDNTADTRMAENNKLGRFGINNLIGEKRQVIPTSLKTRIGYDAPDTANWIKNLTKADPAWKSVHGRTLRQLYSGNANWDEIKIAVESTHLPVLANGDIKTHADIQRALDHTGAFGALIGRGTYGDPFIFSNLQPATSNLKEIMLEHTEIFNNFHQNSERAFVQMRKHFGWYIKGFDGAKELRIKLMQTKSLEEFKEAIRDFELR